MSQPPTNLRALQADQVLELTWDDGSVVRLPYRFIRGNCACAVCVDEWTHERRIDPNSIADDIKIEGLQPVGHYAVNIVWSDGHSSGHFTWETMKRLSDEYKAKTSQHGS